MKKIYIIPTLQVVKIQPAQILAGSEQVGVGEEYSSGKPVLSRQAGFSDDDDWED